jgi:hydrogenase-4 component B
VNPLDILYGAGAAWLAAALTGLLAGSGRPGLRACCGLSALAGAAAVAAGGWSLVYGNTPVAAPGPPTIVGGPVQLQMTSLAGVFVAVLGIVAVAIALYVPCHHQPSRGTAAYLAAYNLALLAVAWLILTCRLSDRPGLKTTVGGGCSR